eukprot:TRINITY_DN3781_c0_g1_i2.p1 TRINITY_DN3781_c0_g1~~TRINITY_DN3781_c0_g1_i2.p1  ORF type:complete len:102 (-),score=8.26 TRINITY_DN3781_c0_g1_i2:2592-2897(-)
MDVNWRCFPIFYFSQWMTYWPLMFLVIYFSSFIKIDAFPRRKDPEPGSWIQYAASQQNAQVNKRKPDHWQQQEYYRCTPIAISYFNRTEIYLFKASSVIVT